MGQEKGKSLYLRMRQQASFFVVYRKPPAMQVVPKSFSYE